MPKKLQIGNAILCDFVGPGQSNKYTIVNAISGNVIVQQIPTGVGFGVYVEIMVDEDRLDQLGIEVRFGGDTLVKGEGKIGGERKLNEPGVLVIPRFEFRVEKEGYLELVLSARGRGETVALRKKIFKGDLPTS